MTIDTAKLGETILATKRRLRSRLPSYATVFAEVEDYVKREVDEVQELKAIGKSVIPEIDYIDVAAGRVSADPQSNGAG